MKHTFLRILTWIGVLLGCSMVAALIWQTGFHGNTSIPAQKWLQFLSVVGTFLVPPIICAYLWDEQKEPFRWLRMDRGAHWSQFAWAIGIMVVALPAINLLAYLNSMIPLPDSLIEAEAESEETLQAFLYPHNAGAVLLNIGLFALLPAIAEEMTFRGTLQQIINGNGLQRISGYRVHLAIWITAIVFSAIHMQFLGFIPRMLMGALFGYMFIWTGSLWIPIVMHLTNNAIAIIIYSVSPENSTADTIGAGSTWWLGVISLMITCLGLLIFYRRTRKRLFSCGF